MSQNNNSNIILILIFLALYLEFSNLTQEYKWFLHIMFNIWDVYTMDTHYSTMGGTNFSLHFNQAFNDKTSH